MENQSFQVGDVVVLKSGSGKMTIEELIGTTACKLIFWDDNQKEIKRAAMPNATLVKVG